MNNIKYKYFFLFVLSTKNLLVRSTSVRSYLNHISISKVDPGQAALFAKVLKGVSMR